MMEIVIWKTKCKYLNNSVRTTRFRITFIMNTNSKKVEKRKKKIVRREKPMNQKHDSQIRLMLLITGEYWVLGKHIIHLFACW